MKTKLASSKSKIWMERETYQKQVARHRCLNAGWLAASWWTALTSFLFLLKRITIVDAKPVGHRTHKARMVLIEADEEQAIVMRIGFQIHCLDSVCWHLSTNWSGCLLSVMSVDDIFFAIYLLIIIRSLCSLFAACSTSLLIKPLLIWLATSEDRENHRRRHIFKNQ